MNLIRNKNIIFNINYVTIIFFVICLTFSTSLLSFLNPQLHGEDEALTFLVNESLTNHISNFNLTGIASELLKDWHPPGRNLLPILSLKIFGLNLSSLRLPYLLIWIITCILATLITKKYSNNLFAFTCGFLLGGSGLFHIQTMALSHGVVTFVGMLIVYLITRNEYLISKKISSKQFFSLSMILYIGFLFFNTLILVAFMLHLIQFFLIIKHKNIRIELRNFILISLLITSLYIIYYLIFLGIPYLMVNSQEFIFFLQKTFQISDFGNWDGKNFGQLHQYTVRSDSSKLNFSSILNNIRYLNWHFFPFLSIIIIIFGIITLWSNFKLILVLFTPYFIITNFYMIGNTAQHFTSNFIWLIPFSCIFLSKIIKNNVFKYIFNAAICISLLSFTIWAHIYPYNEHNYPYKTINYVYGDMKWPSNLNRPLQKISNIIHSQASKKDVIGFTTDGAISLYYLRDLKTIQITNETLKKFTSNNCEQLKNKIQILISNKNLTSSCLSFIAKKYTFNNSNLRIYIFK